MAFAVAQETQVCVSTHLMKIKHLVIENFKSIEKIELENLNPFTVFVGPNGSGKSNIFEALEFHISESDESKKLRLFGGRDYLQNRHLTSTKQYSFSILTDSFTHSRTSSSYVQIEDIDRELRFTTGGIFINDFDHETNDKNYKLFADSFSRIFVRNERLQKQNYNDDSRLNLSCSNLEKVLKRLLSDNDVRSDVIEWLNLFVPRFENTEIFTDDVSGNDTLRIYEKGLEKPFGKSLISDGTYNILALLTAVYQSDEPQFLCIEEPENGLNPKVVKELVNLCRYACEEYGHSIWLNTHSQTLVSALTPDEIILVDKKESATQTKQIKGMNLHGLPMDEAWLSNALGGGLPW